MPFADDPEGIPNETVLVRVLRDPMWWHPRDNPVRPSSLAFFESTREASCFIAAEADFAVLSERFPGTKYGRVTAGAAREAGLFVCRDDEGGDGLPGHVIIGVSLETDLKKYRKATEKLAKTGTIFTPENY